MKNRLSLVVGISLCAFALQIHAHGPSRQRVEERITVDVPAAKAWALIGDFNGLHRWVPAVAESVATNGNDPGSERTLTIKGGEQLKESLEAYDPATMTLRYRMKTPNVKVLPVNNYSATIFVTEEGPSRSTVHWKGAFYRGYMNNDPPAELNDDAAIKAVSGLYQASLANLKKVIESEK